MRRNSDLNPTLIKRYFRIFGQNAHSILDLGCGIGSLGRYKSIPSSHIFGIDLNVKLLKTAKNFEYVIQSDLEQNRLPFKDSSFDGILAKDILEHLQHPWKLLPEIRRVMKPKGILLVSCPLPYPRVVWGDYAHVRGFTKSALQALLEENEFTIHSMCKMGGIPGFGRFGLTDFVPMMLTFPGFSYFFASSWEVVAHKNSEID